MEATFLTANRTGKVRFVKKDGRDYAVAPLTLIVPGVLNGSKGALYYPPDEVRDEPSKWNEVPLVDNHPHVGGKPVSACEKGVLNKVGLGCVMNAKYRGKLVSEGWFDLKKTKRVNVDVYNKLMAQEPIELSTGLFTDNEEAPAGATFNGRSYDFIARNYRPDHVAVLSSQVGACSIQDGCGVSVDNSEGPSMKCPKCGGEINNKGMCANCGYAMNADVTQPRHPTKGHYQGKAKVAAEKGFQADEELHDEADPIEDEDEEIGQGDRPADKRTDNVLATYNRDWPQEKRDKLADKDFAGPGQSFPIQKQSDVDAAAHLVGKAADPEAVKGRIKAIAKRKGLTVPDSWDKTDNAEGMSHEETRDKLHKALRKGLSQDDPAPYINEVHDDHVIYDHGGDTYKHEYETNDDGEVKLGKKQQVQRQVSYVPVHNKGEGMAEKFNRAEAVKFLQAPTNNCDCWKGAAAEKTLNNLTDEQLKKLVDNEKFVINAKAEGSNADVTEDQKTKARMAKKEDEEDGDNKIAKGDEDTVKNSKKTAQQWFAEAPPEIQEIVGNAQKILVGEKEKLVGKLTAHIRDDAKRTVTVNKLMGKKIDELRELVDIMPQPTNNSPFTPVPTSPIFAGMGGYVGGGTNQVENAEQDPDILDVPTINFAAEAAAMKKQAV